MSPASVVVFTRDLRVHDNPALHEAVRSGPVVPLFVVDDALVAGTASTPRRVAFLAESLRDLHDSLVARGAGLLTRRGRWVDEVLATAAAAGAELVHIADDHSGFAQSRLAALRSACEQARVELRVHPGVTVVPPGDVVPAGRDSFSVFTPYWRSWTARRWRAVLSAPRVIDIVDGLRAPIAEGPDRVLAATAWGAVAAGGALATGIRPGESAARARVSAWRSSGLDRYDERHDDLAGAATSKLSAYLHFGCLSPLELATHLRARPGGEPFVRQLCWRDFFYQVAAAHPQAIWANLRPGALPWQPPEPSRAQEYLDAWRRGETGYPIVDAAMRQLLEEGFVHNRARLVAASFLTKDLGLPWWDGARHYLAHLVDADVVVNNFNWQWVAGTGNDTNRYRVFNPTRQAERFDPDSAYIKRYLPQFAALPAKAARDPDPQTRPALGYPSPIVSSASSRR